MIERGSGHIVNITSVNGVHPAPSIGTYGAAKAALQSLTQLWANEWGPHGIRVNAIAPGFIDAGMSKPIFENPKVREVRSGGVPLRAIGTADDISGALLFLDSDDAGYITGHELVVDGGVINSVLMHLPRENPLKRRAGPRKRAPPPRSRVVRGTPRRHAGPTPVHRAREKNCCQRQR